LESKAKDRSSPAAMAVMVGTAAVPPLEVT